MNLAQLEDLVATSEKDDLEFKKSTALLKSAAQTLCGFLNNHGGIVLIGVTDAGKIVGQHVTDNTRQEIVNELQKFEPFSKIKIEYIDLPNSDKKVIVLTAHDEPDGIPYVYDGRAYERVDSVLVRMPQQKYQQLLLDKILAPNIWENLPALVGIDRLDHQEIIEAINKGIIAGRFKKSVAMASPEEALIRFKLINNGKITNAAAVLFCEDPLPEYTQCLIRLVRYRGTEKRGFIDNQQIYGNAFTLLKEAEDFVARHISISARFVPGKMRRIDEPTYPPLAVREAVINAIAHRDYTIIGGAVIVSIYDDRLEVISHGTLPKGIKVADLKIKHNSHPRNQLITHALFRCGIIESVGTGTQEMLGICKEFGMQEPEFVEQGNTFSVIFKAKQPLSTIHFIKETFADLTIRQRKIYDLVHKNKKMSLQEILKNLRDLMSISTLRRELIALKKAGLIDSEGKTSKAIWFVIKGLNEGD